MPTFNASHHESLCQWIVVGPEPAGQFTAQALGMPELTVTAASRDEAIAQIRGRILEAIAQGISCPSRYRKSILWCDTTAGKIPTIRTNKPTWRSWPG